MPDNRTGATLILFAKAPIPGQVKTRLTPQLDPQQAAQVATALIEHTVSLAIDNWPGPVTLQVWPDTQHEIFRRLSGEYGISLSAQSAGDLGRKICTALKAHTDHGQAAAVMGCDVPHCPGQVLTDAYELLEQGSANVIGPSTDGGYYLIGVQQTQPALFRGINWGNDRVFATTLENALAFDISFTRLKPLQDIDNFKDLERAAKDASFLNKWLR